MNQFYVDPYVDDDQSSDRRAARKAVSAKRPLQAPSYSPSASPASTASASASAATPSPSPSPHGSSRAAPAATARERPASPYMSPPRRPPTLLSPTTTPGASTHTDRRSDMSEGRGQSSATEGGADTPVGPRHDAPTVPRTRGPGSRMVVPGSKRFDQFHRRRSSMNLTNALNADGDEGSAVSGTTVPSLFATMHSRRRVRVDGAGSTATLMSRHGTGLDDEGASSLHGGGATTHRSRLTGGREDEDADDGNIETLELPMQHYVAQSAYTMRNPFRTQDFAAFAANPNYVHPPHIATYTEVPTCGDGLFSSQRASEGAFLINRLADLTMPANEADRARVYAFLGRTLEVLQTGEWFLKWTHNNNIKQRFVWLNLQRGTIMWSSSAKQSLFDNSELKLSTVTDVKPDCIQDETSGRVFYRMQVRTPDHWKTFATELREKFDMWFQALVELTRPNLTSGLPGVWGRPSAVSNTDGRGVPGRWTARYSLLSAIADGADGQLQTGGMAIEGRTSSGD